jgi:hypothetical protein
MKDKQTFYLGLRFYQESYWGWRKLGTKRYALDLGKFSILFEIYSS